MVDSRAVLHEKIFAILGKHLMQFPYYQGIDVKKMMSEYHSDRAYMNNAVPHFWHVF